MPASTIHTDHAPAAIGPYSQAVRAGNTVYLSGQIPLDPATGELVDGDIAAQARRVFDNLKRGLRSRGRLARRSSCASASTSPISAISPRSTR